ncbi:MAG: tRNA epoxyqueuosine(34) reductase QueG [Phycisphaerales bacterium]
MPRKPPPTTRPPNTPAPDPTRTADDILSRAKQAGFALAGISPAQASHYQQELRDWLAAGKHGDMDYLTADLATRLDPTRILEGTKSFIVVADFYASRYSDQAQQPSEGRLHINHNHTSLESSGEVHNSIFNTESTESTEKNNSENVPRTQSSSQPKHSVNHSSLSAFSALSVLKIDSPKPSDSHTGKIARYAQGKNYHDVIKRRLHKLADQLRIDYPGSEFRTCVDTAPVNERELAALAGLGWQAKHTLVINPKLGSYMLLGVVATTLDLTPSMPRERPTLPDSCGTCTRCIDACPTQAITPYSVDARRCISYLTIEHRGLIDPQFFRGMNNWIFGCDICQEVCPHNSPRSAPTVSDSAVNITQSGPQPTHYKHAHTAYTAKNTHFDLLQVLSWSEQNRREAFTNSPMKRATLAMMKRNALIALGNVIQDLESQLSNPNRSTTSPTAATLRARIAHIASDANESDLIRQTAAEVLRWLDAAREKSGTCYPK